MNQESSNLFDNVNFHYISPDEDEEPYFREHMYSMESPRLFNHNHGPMYEDAILDAPQTYFRYGDFYPQQDHILQKFNDFHLCSYSGSGVYTSENAGDSIMSGIESYLKQDSSENINKMSPRGSEQRPHGYTKQIPKKKHQVSDSNNTKTGKKVSRQLFKVQKCPKRTFSKMEMVSSENEDSIQFDYSHCSNSSRNLTTQFQTILESLDSEASMNLYQIMSNSQRQHFYQYIVSQIPTVSQELLTELAQDDEQNAFLRALSLLKKEQYRHSCSLTYRTKRREAKLLQERILTKNKNRQIAALKRQRDQNGKFQGGVQAH